MGSACAPRHDSLVMRHNTETEDVLGGNQPCESTTKTINNDQSEKEQLKKELEDKRVKANEDAAVLYQLAKQNKETKDELAEMKAQLEAKERALLKHRLEVALQSKATSMIITESESFAKQLIAGNLEKFSRTKKAKSAKAKWVEINLHNCTKTSTGLERGYMILTYSESKKSELSNRCKIIRVIGEGVNVGEKYDGRCFSVEAYVGSEEREFVFASPDEITKNKWVKAIRDGFALINEELNEMNELFTLKVEFLKEKLGISVYERILETKLDNTEFCDIDNPTLEQQNGEGDISKEEVKGTEIDDEAKNSQDDATDEEQVVNTPCELVVNEVTDNDISASGLIRDLVIIAVNDINMKGMTYDEQIEVLTATSKPFTITFEGPRYLQKKSVRATAYPELLQNLVAEGDNSVKAMFYDLVKGTPFGEKLDFNDDKVSVTMEMLSDQRMLTDLLQTLRL